MTLPVRQPGHLRALHRDRAISRLLAGLATTALAGGPVVACGGTSGGGGSGATLRASGAASSQASSGNPLARKNDRDNDSDNNDDDAGIVEYGHAAGTTDRRISVALVTRYYAAAAAEDGTGACALLVPVIAEAVAEQNAHSLGLGGPSCPVVLRKLFERNHRLLAGKHASLKVVTVRVEGNRALAVLEFPSIPETRQITERRVGSTWRLVDLLDELIE